jgi:hypothetical protein
VTPEALPPALPDAPRSRAVDRTTPADAAPLDPVADQWERLVKDAVEAVSAAVRAPLDDAMTEERYRAHRVRLLGADRILGFRKGGLPMPTPKALGIGELELKGGATVIRLRWADGAPVVLPLHDPHAARGARDQDEDLE